MSLVGVEGFRTVKGQCAHTLIHKAMVREEWVIGAKRKRTEKQDKDGDEGGSWVVDGSQGVREDSWSRQRGRRGGDSQQLYPCLFLSLP